MCLTHWASNWTDRSVHGECTYTSLLGLFVWSALVPELARTCVYIMSNTLYIVLSPVLREERIWRGVCYMHMYLTLSIVTPQMGSSSHDSVTVPFQLPPGLSQSKTCSWLRLFAFVQVLAWSHAWLSQYQPTCCGADIIHRFCLSVGTANECQFTFYVQSFQVPQKLRGTATYMVKVGWWWSQG